MSEEQGVYIRILTSIKNNQSAPFDSKMSCSSFYTQLVKKRQGLECKRWSSLYHVHSIVIDMLFFFVFLFSNFVFFSFYIRLFADHDFLLPFSVYHLLTTTKLHLFAKCFYLHLKKKPRETKSIHKHERKWCRRAASSLSLSSLLLFLSQWVMFVWSFNFM